MLHPSATYVTHPNPSVSGAWAPLSTARHFFSKCPATPLRASMEVFLSNKLVVRFPSASRDFWRVSKPGRMLGQFGVCFGGGIVRPYSEPVIRRRASTSCSPPPPPISTREVSLYSLHRSRYRPLHQDLNCIIRRLLKCILPRRHQGFWRPAAHFLTHQTCSPPPPKPITRTRGSFVKNPTQKNQSPSSPRSLY
jgi:hypothetical protein